MLIYNLLLSPCFEPTQQPLTGSVCPWIPYSQGAQQGVRGFPTCQQIAGTSLRAAAQPGRNFVGGSMNEALPTSACPAVTVAWPNSPSNWAGSRPPGTDD